MQMPPGMHGGQGSGEAAAPKGDQGPASKAYAEANARMHAEMDIEFSGDADRDFARGMIAHHNGAIAMAKILLEHGSDPELRKLAEEVIEAQSEEIEFLQAWLEKNGSN
ncbi:CopM family metallochaperone [Faunimonas sp. B44]|uniref:CopM family metallochaperone n=1 Tax=Faunimonas sp. B44 TaxID=3461493 RepID=UPI00404409E1